MTNETYMCSLYEVVDWFTAEGTMHNDWQYVVMGGMLSCYQYLSGIGIKADSFQYTAHLFHIAE